MYYFQNYWNFDLECKHGRHKTTFRARKDIGTFEKRAPEQLFFPRFWTYLLFTLITHFDMVDVFFFLCLRKHHNVELETMDANINAPMACAPVIRATIWPQIRRIVSPRIVICQSHHIVHQVSKHKGNRGIKWRKQTNKQTITINNNNLRIIWKKIMAVIADATFAVAKRKLSYRNCKSCVFKCNDLLSYNSLPRSSHIWFPHIHNFSNLRVTLFRSMRRVFIYHGPKNVFSDIRTSKLVCQLLKSQRS